MSLQQHHGEGRGELVQLLSILFVKCRYGTAELQRSIVTDKAQKASISTIKDLDNGRLYVMDYTADYKLDKMLQQNVNSVDTMLAFVGRELLEKMEVGSFH